MNLAQSEALILGGIQIGNLFKLCLAIDRGGGAQNQRGEFLAEDESRVFILQFEDAKLFGGG